MYSNYQSLKSSIEKEISNQQSVLNKFPDSIARSIVQACAKYLAQFTSSQLPFSNHSSTKADRTSSETSIYSNRDSHHFQSSTNSTITSFSDLNNDKFNFIVLETSEQINWVLEVSSNELRINVLNLTFDFLEFNVWLDFISRLSRYNKRLLECLSRLANCASRRAKTLPAKTY